MCPLRNQHGNRTADHLLGGVAIQPLGAAIPAEDHPIQIFADDGVVGRFDNGRQEAAGFFFKSEGCHGSRRSSGKWTQLIGRLRLQAPGRFAPAPSHSGRDRRLSMASAARIPCGAPDRLSIDPVRRGRQAPPIYAADSHGCCTRGEYDHRAISALGTKLASRITRTGAPVTRRTIPVDQRSSG